MTETSLGWHQVGCSMQMHGPATANDLSPSLRQLISFLDIGRHLDDRTLPDSPSVCPSRASKQDICRNFWFNGT